MYFKNFTNKINWYYKYLHEFTDFELRIGGNICILLSLYRSSTQNEGDFLENLELHSDYIAEKKVFLMIALSDFNTKSWYTNSSTNFKGSKIYFLSYSNNLIK